MALLLTNPYDLRPGLAWVLKRGPVVSPDWMNARRQMGQRANLTRAVAAYERATHSEHRRLRKRLHLCAH